MSMRVTSLAVLLVAVVATGCTGPTKTGQEARTGAYERANIMSAQVQFDQARQAYRRGDFKKALREIEAALNRRPEASEYYVLRGKIYMEMQKLERAAADFELAAAFDEASGEPHYYAGIVHQRWSQDEKAKVHYMKAAELDESNPAYLLAAAETAIALGQLDEAHDMVEPRLDYFENNASMHHLLGQVAVLRNQFDEAIESYERAVMLNDGDDMLMEELAHVQFDAGEFGSCLKTLSRLDTLRKTTGIESLRLKARCMTHLERPEEARDAFVELTRKSPEDIDGWVELAAVAFSADDWRRVADSSARIVTLAPYRYEGYLFRGAVEQRRGNSISAERLFRRAAQLAPDEPLPHLMLGKLLEEQGDRMAAADAFAAAESARIASTAMAGVGED